VHRYRVSPALCELSGGNYLPTLTLKGVGDNRVNGILTLLKVLARWRAEIDISNNDPLDIGTLDSSGIERIFGCCGVETATAHIPT
jgi:hypothetical protein